MSDDSLRAIVDFYTQIQEEDRLVTGSSLLEFERTKELLRRFLPLPPATVMDVGGASGAYAFWLASLGYGVHLVDATPRLVELARQRDGSASHHLTSITVGDARRLSLDDASIDAVL